MLFEKQIYHLFFLVYIMLFCLFFLATLLYRSMESHIRRAGRALYFFAGFHRIKVIGERAEGSEAPVIVCGPHSSFFDVAVNLVTRHIAASVNRIENSKIFMLGST